MVISGNYKNNYDTKTSAHNSMGLDPKTTQSCIQNYLVGQNQSLFQAEHFTPKSCFDLLINILELLI